MRAIRSVLLLALLITGFIVLLSLCSVWVPM
jgi:hypothetical protein